MNSRGFSTVLTIVGLVILVPLLLLAFHGISVGNQKHQIEDQIAGLHLQKAPESTQCDGDGIDSNPWCQYEYTIPTTTIEKALQAAGYAQDTSDGSQSNTTHKYIGGNPKMLFKVSTSNGMTVLYGERSE
ncbi:hypothetical protein EYC59_04145 [Candidatus Saccharibacteria bacterium]|nr:MAG: hypothetical protein EYC59_04145 [Candidatus Saccharibacteria bacterium]